MVVCLPPWQESFRRRERCGRHKGLSYNAFDEIIAIQARIRCARDRPSSTLEYASISPRNSSPVIPAG